MAIDTIKSTAVLDGAIATADIADDAVTGAKIENNPTIAGTLAVTGHGSVGNAGTVAGTRALTVVGATDGTSSSIIVGYNSSLASKFSVRDDGYTAVGAGMNVQGNISLASSAGIDFSGNANASGMSSELLDDYEEGTWTAQIVGSSSNPSSAVTMPSATYTKIGRLVFVQFQFSNVNTTGASGGVRISGLPFAATTSHGTGNILTYVGMTFPTTSTNISPYVSGTDMSFYYSTSNQGWAEITHNATSGVYLAVTATYQTNA